MLKWTARNSPEPTNSSPQPLKACGSSLKRTACNRKPRKDRFARVSPARQPMGKMRLRYRFGSSTLFGASGDAVVIQPNAVAITPSIHLAPQGTAEQCLPLRVNNGIARTCFLGKSLQTQKPPKTIPPFSPLQTLFDRRCYSFRKACHTFFRLRTPNSLHPPSRKPPKSISVLKRRVCCNLFCATLHASEQSVKNRTQRFFYLDFSFELEFLIFLGV